MDNTLELDIRKKHKHVKFSSYVSYQLFACNTSKSVGHGLRRLLFFKSDSDRQKLCETEFSSSTDPWTDLYLPVPFIFHRIYRVTVGFDKFAHP